MKKKNLKITQPAPSNIIDKAKNKKKPVEFTGLPFTKYGECYFRHFNYNKFLNTEFEALRRQITNLFLLVEYDNIPEIIQVPNEQQLNFALLVKEIVYQCLDDGKCPMQYLSACDEHADIFLVADHFGHLDKPDFYFDMKHLILSKKRSKDLLEEALKVSDGLAMTSQLFIVGKSKILGKQKEQLEEKIELTFDRGAVILENGLEPKTIDGNRTGGDNIRDIYAKAVYRAFGASVLYQGELTQERLLLLVKTIIEPCIIYILAKINYHYNFDITYNLAKLENLGVTKYENRPLQSQN
jgi:hypothetical protein